MFLKINILSNIKKKIWSKIWNDTHMWWYEKQEKMIGKSPVYSMYQHLKLAWYRNTSCCTSRGEWWGGIVLEHYKLQVNDSSWKYYKDN